MDTPKPKHGGKLFVVFGIVALIAAAGITLRLHSASALRNESKDDAVPMVAVIKAAKGPQTEEIVLPGNVQAWHEATIYSRINGFVKDWYIKMGTHVHEGDLLAEIDAPEIDAQLRQAEADLKTAEANNMLAQSTAERWKELLKTDSVSKQEADEKVADAAAKAAAMASARASRDHLKEITKFKRVVAPFDGVISSRTLDIGMLVNDGTLGPQAALYHIVQADRLLIYIQVPQNDAGAITPDIAPELHFVEHPGKSYPAKFRSSAQAVDPVSRTLLISLEADNKDGELLSGGYAEVHIKLPVTADSIRLPVNTLIFRADGLQVATVDAGGHALLKNITMGRDFGNMVEVLAGIEPDEAVIVNPADSLVSGELVRVAPVAQKDEKKP